MTRTVNISIAHHSKVKECASEEGMLIGGMVEDYYFKGSAGNFRRVKAGTSRRVTRFITSKKYKLIETRHLTPRDFSYMKRRRSGVTKPLPLRNLYWEAVADGLDRKTEMAVHKQKSKQLDLFDVGGCGCDFSQTDATACNIV